MKITLHSSMCVASGNCGFVAPEVFSNPEDNFGFAQLDDPAPPETQHEAVRSAEYLCPSKAIQVDENDVPAGDQSR
ncbi:ferredoxin [Brevibacterium renqingii]|uniref:ferredoxin n=1 Tax=Brevibacterium renqingii TaxID=2776916 RepID=UPI001AE0659A|nr:ferredoxin [Brevibacterium renqingii]